MTLKVGQKAQLIQPTIQGDIIDTEYDKDAKELRHLISWVDGDGETQTRWFKESELEAV